MKIVGLPIRSLAGSPAVVWPDELGAGCSVADLNVEPEGVLELWQVSKSKEMGLGQPS
jgi:hypothetical protein